MLINFVFRKCVHKYYF